MIKEIFKIVLIMIFACAVYANDLYYYNNNQKKELVFVEQIGNITYYHDTNGVLFGVGNTIIISLKDVVKIAKILEDFNLEIEEVLGSGIYLLSTQDIRDTIDIANKINNLNSVKFAQPDFIKERFLK